MTFNPLWTIGHICHTIFGPIRMCGYLHIAPKRLKIWKKSAAVFCSSWNCASNKPNYRSIAIVVPKIFAVKVLRRLSKKTRKSQNLIVFKGLTWPKISKNFSKNHQISSNISFLAQKLIKKTHFGAIWNFSHLCINPLWTIGHICHTIFGPRRRCAYL